MLAFLLQRLAQGAGVVFAMAVIVFFGVNVIGDPVYMLVSPDQDQAAIAETTRALGLDRPIGEQFLLFLGNALRGDLGRSFVHNEPAISLVLARMPATLELALVALVASVAVGLPLGLHAGLKPEAASSRAVMGLSILGFSLPTFWVGLMLILLFSVELGWLPATGRGDTARVLGIETSLATRDGWAHIALPALNLALLNLALVIRLARAGAREAVMMDYVRFARAKGLSSRRVVGVHVLKNIMIPIVTVVGIELGSLVAFSVVTESIFAWPGMGRLLLEAIQRLDRPVVVAYVMVIVVLFVVINVVVDIATAALDPRVRLGREAS